MAPPRESLLLTLTEVRAIALRSQGLAEEEAPFGEGKEAVLRAFQHLGYVQIDSVRVIQRAHHHVLWSRVPDYHPDLLHELHSQDAAVFEYWNHAASYLPTRDYRFSRPLMRKYRGKLHWSTDTPELRKSMRRLLGLIRKNGPLMVSDLETAGMEKSWFEHSFAKIERRAFHELWMRGDVMIRSRKGVQKVFDLPSKVLPVEIDTTYPSKPAAAEFHVRRALRALGVARAQELHYLQDAGQAVEVRKALAKLVKQGKAVELHFPEAPKAPVYAWREALGLRAPVERGAVRFLSPFDNLVIQRKRLKWLFDFDYTVEIYVPAAKRIYGYFVLPILWGDRIIGRMDTKADRAARRLLIHNLVFEPAFDDFAELKPAFITALDQFTRFQGCDDWAISRSEPATFLALMKAGAARRAKPRTSEE